MTDKQMYKELEKFANDHTLARDMEISIRMGSKHFTAINGTAKYEDLCLLHDLIRGVEHYLMWKRRKKEKR